jgi:hypothetical protein
MEMVQSQLERVNARARLVYSCRLEMKWDGSRLQGAWSEIGLAS